MATPRKPGASPRRPRRPASREQPDLKPDLRLEAATAACAELTRQNAQLAEANQALAESHSQLEAMLENIPDRIYFKDRQSRFLRVNRAVATKLGLAAHELARGKTDFDFYGQRAQDFFADEQRLLESGQPLVNKIERQATPEGVVTWASVTKVPLRDSMGRVVGLIGISRDVTAQMQAEEALRKSHDELEQRVAKRTAELAARNEELKQLIAEQEKTRATLANERRLLRTLIDNLPDAIYAKDTASRKTLANPADLKTLRCKTEAEAIGKNDFDLFPHDIAAKFFADDQAVLAGAPVLDREEFFIDEQGGKRWLLTSKLPLRDENQAVVGLVGISRDITALKEAEQKLEAAQRKLINASHQAGMAEVAIAVLHNVGNVLTSVNTSGGVIRQQLRLSKVPNVSRVAKLLLDHTQDLGRFIGEDEHGRQVPEYLKELGEHLEREQQLIRAELEGLIRNLEHINQIVASQQSYASTAGVLETLDLASLLEDALRIHGGAYEEHHIQLVREYKPLPPISVDSHKVLQILVNLLGNARHACEAGKAARKQVIVRLKAGAPGWARIEVADNGVGIAPELMPRLFTQGFTTRKAGHGFGLHSGALAARELGGVLTAQSAGPNRGATFILELPLTPPVGR